VCAWGRLGSSARQGGGIRARVGWFCRSGLAFRLALFCEWMLLLAVSAGWDWVVGAVWGGGGRVGGGCRGVGDGMFRGGGAVWAGVRASWRGFGRCSSGIASQVMLLVS